MLRTIMATTEPEDFDAITKVLESAKSAHELKWIIRCIVDYVAEDPDGKLLQVIKNGTGRGVHYSEDGKTCYDSEYKNGQVISSREIEPGERPREK